MFWFILWLIWAIVWGIITKVVNENKGYYGGFAWGFFLGFIGLIVVATKERRERYGYGEYVSSSTAYAAQKEVSDNYIMSEGGWRCSECGAVNPNYTGTCGCGNTRQKEAEISTPNYPVSSESRGTSETAKNKENDEQELLNLQKLKAYKDLLDSGVISQEDFDKKKSELLN